VARDVQSPHAAERACIRAAECMLLLAGRGRPEVAAPTPTPPARQAGRARAVRGAWIREALSKRYAKVGANPTRWTGRATSRLCSAGSSENAMPGGATPRVRMLWEPQKGQMAAGLRGRRSGSARFCTRIAQFCAQSPSTLTGAARPHHTPSLDRLRRRERQRRNDQEHRCRIKVKPATILDDIERRRGAREHERSARARRDGTT